MFKTRHSSQSEPPRLIQKPQTCEKSTRMSDIYPTNSTIKSLSLRYAIRQIGNNAERNSRSTVTTCSKSHRQLVTGFTFDPSPRGSGRVLGGSWGGPGSWALVVFLQCGPRRNYNIYKTSGWWRQGGVAEGLKGSRWFWFRHPVVQWRRRLGVFYLAVV